MIGVQAIKEKALRDRRHYARFNLSFPLSLSDGEESGGTAATAEKTAQLRDVSRSGFRFSTTRFLNVGENIFFSLQFSATQSIHGMARTCWVSASDGALCRLYGAEITALPWGQRRALKRTLEPPAQLFSEQHLIDLVLFLACGLVYLRIFQEFGFELGFIPKAAAIAGAVLVLASFIV